MRTSPLCVKRQEKMWKPRPIFRGKIMSKEKAYGHEKGGLVQFKIDIMVNAELGKTCRKQKKTSEQIKG